MPGGVVTQPPDGTRTALPHEIEERTASNNWHERLISHYADRGEVTIDVHREALALHTPDGLAFDLPLRVRVTTEAMRHQMRAADDPGAVWASIVAQIDRLAAVVGSGQAELDVTEASVQRRRL